MGLRSIKPGLLAAPMFQIHPKTGEMVVPLGYGKDGSPWWPVMGGAPEDDEDKSDDDKSDDDDDDEDEEDESDDKSDEDEDDDSDEDDKSKSKKKGNPQAKIKALEEEKDRHYKKFKAEKKRADDLEARMRALEEKSMKPEELEDRRRKDQEAKDKEAQASTQRLRLENAFLKATRTSDIEWVDPEDALSILLNNDDYEVEFDSDGNVDRRSLRAELKRLAKAKPHLVKSKQSKGDEGDGKDSGSQGQTASTMNGNRKGKKGQQPTREQLAKKFPALNRLT